MNTLIKRSMKLAFALVFIGASVIPAYAQKNILQGLSRSLTKKRPPLTGGTGTLLPGPVVPRVPPTTPLTLTGAAALNFRSAVDAALETKVTRQLIQTTLPAIEQPPALDMSAQAEVVTPAISNTATGATPTTPSSTLNTVSQRKQILKLIAKPFGNAFNHLGPQYIFVPFDPEIDRKNLSLRPGKRKEETYRKVIEMFEKCDAIFFHEHDGGNFIDLFSIYFHPLYEESLLVGTKRNASDISLANIAISEYKDFIDMRNKQIMDAALRAHEISTLQEAQLADPTTQRTAEEIQFLLENLDPQNPLRQSFESTLNQTVQAGHISPISTRQVPEGLLNNEEAVDASFAPSH